MNENSVNNDPAAKALFAAAADLSPATLDSANNVVSSIISKPSLLMTRPRAWEALLLALAALMARTAVSQNDTAECKAVIRDNLGGIGIGIAIVTAHLEALTGKPSTFGGLAATAAESASGSESTTTTEPSTP